MSERSYGAKYDLPCKVTGKTWASAADIAKLIRADIKAAITAGDLPGTTRNYSVRCDHGSLTQAIRITTKDLDGMWRRCPGVIADKYGPGSGTFSCGDSWCKAGGEFADSPHAKYHQILTAEGRRVKALLQQFHDDYNHNGSDSMTDYFDQRYWGHADIGERPVDA